MAMNPAQQSGAQVGGGQNFTPASLYVGELKSEVTEAFLFEMFNTVGPVASIRVCRDVVTRRSLGYAYVNFHSVNDAERALDTMNFSMIRGHPCRIMWSQRDPSLRKSGVGNIFVKNLDKSIDHKTLYDTFSMFGSILSCKVATDENGESRGYGFVHYENQESADRAIQKVDGMVIAAREVHVKPFLPKSQRVGANNAQSFTNLYIKGLDKENVDEAKLKEMFAPFGTINSLHLARDKEQQKSRGFGFVNFAEPEDARKAIEDMNDKDGLTVCRAQKREERDRVLRQSFDKLRLEQAEKYAGVNLYIKNLDDTLDDADLEKEFTGYGVIDSAKIMRTPDGRSKGFGFVMFQSRDAAAKAVAEMNGKMLKQKPLYVALAQRKEERRQFLEAQAQVARTKMAAMPHQMYGPPHGGPQHPGMFYQGGPQGMPQGPGGPQGPHGMPPGTPMGVAPQMPRGGAQTPQGFMYGAPHNQMGMNDPRNPQGGMGGPQGGRGGPWAQGPRTPNGPGGMMMNQRGPQGPNMYMMGGNMHQGGRGGMGGGRGRGRGGGGRGGDRGIQFQHGVRNNPQQAPTQQGPPANGAVPQQSNGVPPQGAAAQPAAATAAAAQPAAAVAPGPLTSQALARAPAQQQKQMIGERIYPKIQELEPNLAGKITGMLLEMDNTELLHLLESPEALKGKIDEAMIVLQQSGDAPAGSLAASKPAAGSADPAAASSGDDAAAPIAAAGDA